MTHIDDTDDEHGHRIVQCKRRPDLIAMADTYASMEANGISLADTFFLFGFAHSLYWPFCDVFRVNELRMLN